jgi:triacylglycerol esterase/lipase EstA (alpha/beta hydrolase family)
MLPSPVSRSLSISASLVAVLLTACVADDSAPYDDSVPDEQAACEYLNAGDCGGKADGTGGITSYDWTTPEFWGDQYLSKYAAQRTQFNTHIEAGPTPLAQPRTVLLITGVTIRAAWFDGIVTRLRRDGFNPVVWEPPALLSGNLLQASHDLAAVVERVKAESGQDKIDILAECTGGVISRYYVQSLGGDANVGKIVTFVSPQHGLFGAKLLSYVMDWPALKDLTPGSAFLNAVNAKTPNVPFTSIYTCDDEYIQPYTGSQVPGATNIKICGNGFVGHFRTMYDPQIYMVMHDALVK